MTKEPKIQVTLLAVTAGCLSGLKKPEQILIYTKSTRLEQGKGTRVKIKNMKEDERSKELEYMANTIPSSWEFIDYTFEILNVTRAFTHQFVRTRTGSYAQQTMRLLEKKDFTYRIPPKLHESGREQQRWAYKECMKMIQEVYDRLLASDIPAEDARGVLPTNIHTNIIAKFNLRTLAEMARSRTGTRTQDEYREVMDLMLNAVIDVHPWAFRFLFPEEGKHIKALESVFEEMFKSGTITQEKKLENLKHLDALRKGKS